MTFFTNLLTIGSLVAAGIAIFSVLHSPASLKDVSEPLPLPLFIAQQMTVSFLESSARLMQNPIQTVLGDAFAYARTQTVYTACALDIATHLGSKGMSMAELAHATHSNADHLHRVMRSLTGQQYFHFDTASSKWVNTALSSVLRKDHPNYICPFVAHLVEDTWAPWSLLTDAVKTQDGSFDAFGAANGGITIWQYYAANATQGEQFARAMSNVDHFTWYASVHDYNWKKYHRIIDVGGSLGSLLSKLMYTHSHLKGVLFDLPEVIDKARHVWDSRHTKLHDRITLVPGSFFDTGAIPTAQEGDAYMLRVVLHDWNEEKAIAILRNVRAAIGSTPNVKLVLVEQVISEHNEAITARSLLDLHMMVVTGFDGRERTAGEWRELLTSAGFALRSINPVRSLVSIIEAEPV